MKTRQTTPRETLARLPGEVVKLDLGAPAPHSRQTTAKPGWRRKWNQGDHSAAERPAVPVPAVRGALSKRQISVLIRHARVSYDIQAKAGLTDLSFDEWRHLECARACGCDGLTKAGNKHFRALLSHFLLLSGDSAGLKIALKTGPADGYQGETIEDREQAIYLVRKACKDAGLHENYARSIARRQFHVESLDALNAAQAMALLYTLTRRAKGDKK